MCYSPELAKLEPSALRDIPFPVCLFFFTMEDDQGYYKWVKESGLTSKRTPKLALNREPELKKLTNREIGKIISKVNAWYDAPPQRPGRYKTALTSSWRVSYTCTSNFCEGGQRMRLQSGVIHNVFNGDAADCKSVCNKRSMTSPGYRFRAHNNDQIILDGLK